MGDGTRAALEMAQAVKGGEDGGEVEQLDLATLLGLPAPTAHQSAQIHQRRGAGRPPGARNKRTEAMADYILAQTTPPALTLARMASMPVHELATLLGCSLLDAWQEIRLCAQAVAPYLHQRMPLAVDLTNHKTVTLTIVETGDAGPANEDSLVLDVVEFQEVSEDDPDKL